MNILTIDDINNLLDSSRSIDKNTLIRYSKQLAKGRVIYHHSLDQIPNFNVIVSKGNKVDIAISIVRYLKGKPI